MWCFPFPCPIGLRSQRLRRSKRRILCERQGDGLRHTPTPGRMRLPSSERSAAMLWRYSRKRAHHLSCAAGEPRRSALQKHLQAATFAGIEGHPRIERRDQRRRTLSGCKRCKTDVHYCSPSSLADVENVEARSKNYNGQNFRSVRFSIQNFLAPRIRYVKPCCLGMLVPVSNLNALRLPRGRAS
jgi:hypothetical protein